MNHPCPSAIDIHVKFQAFSDAGQYENSLFMFYAPWDRASQEARQTLIEVISLKQCHPIRPPTRTSKFMVTQLFMPSHFPRSRPSSSTRTSWWRRSTAGFQSPTAPRSLETSRWRLLFQSSYSTRVSKGEFNTEAHSGRT